MTESVAEQVVSILLSEDRDVWRVAAELFPDSPPEARRLLPFAYRRLYALGGLQDHPWYAAAASAYRNAWRGNEVRLGRIVPLLSALRTAGIEPVLLKGGALLDDFYGDRGARHMADIDILLPATHLLHSSNIFGDHGWHRTSAVPLTLVPRHDMTFRNEWGEEIDLHQRLFEAASTTLTTRLAAAAVPASRLPASRLCTTDLLFHSVVHGAIIDGRKNPQWLLDAALLHRSGPIDWERFASHTTSERLGSVMASPLEELRMLGLDIPSFPLSPARGSSWSRLSELGSMVRLGGIAAVPAFMTQLKEDWELRSWSGFPAELIRRATRRIARSRSSHP